MPLPSWAPALTDVGAHVPMRTIPIGDLTGAPSGTFSVSTMPTDAQVTLFITAAAEHVESEVGAVDTSLTDLAKAAAAVRAAADVELAQPADQFDQRRYDQLTALAGSLLDSLRDRNAALTGATSGAAGALTPVWVFPAGPAHGDWEL